MEQKLNDKNWTDHYSVIKWSNGKTFFSVMFVTVHSSYGYQVRSVGALGRSRSKVKKLNFRVKEKISAPNLESGFYYLGTTNSKCNLQLKEVEFREVYLNICNSWCEHFSNFILWSEVSLLPDCGDSEKKCSKDFAWMIICGSLVPLFEP